MINYFDKLINSSESLTFLKKQNKEMVVLQKEQSVLCCSNNAAPKDKNLQNQNKSANINLGESLSPKDLNKGYLNKNSSIALQIAEKSLHTKLNCKASSIMRPIINLNSGIAKYQTVLYNFKNSTKISSDYKTHIINILNYFFASISCLISKPIFITSPDLVIIRLCFFQGNLRKSSQKSTSVANRSFYQKTLKRNKFYSSLARILSLNQKKFKLLAIILSKLLKKTVELEFVQVYDLYKDPNILAQAIGSNSKRLKFQRISSSILKHVNIVSPKALTNLKETPTLSFIEEDLKDKLIDTESNFNKNKNLNLIREDNSLLFNKINPIKLTGLKIKLAGRLATEKVIPRKTVKTVSQGTFVKNKVNFVNSGTFTSKNKNGAFTFTV